MITIEWGLPIFIFLLLLDLLLAATRVSLLNTRPLRLISLQVEKKTAVEKTIALIENPRLRPTLRFSQTLADLGRVAQRGHHPAGAGSLAVAGPDVD